MAVEPDTIRFVAVEVAGKQSPSRLLHREDCPHLHSVQWPEPVLREATDEERRSMRPCTTCLARERRERSG